MKKRVAKPFLKWAGGKTQLLSSIEANLPDEIKAKQFNYIEPFVGSGAVFFWLINNFSNVEKVIINDINSDLINTYEVVKNNVDELIEILQEWESEYHLIDDNLDLKKEYYYQKRESFNLRNPDSINHAALFIFLNRTCFNGLYRVNRNNLFNVPIGSYKKPMICDTENLIAVSDVLQNVTIVQGDFADTLKYAANNTFFYLDPPYKPLNQTSSFNSYAKDEFNDTEQIRLRDFCHKLDEFGYKWILSNSDVKDKDSHDDFFDTIYEKYTISRVKARRSINANADKRGELNELLITNY